MSQCRRVIFELSNKLYALFIKQIKSILFMSFFKKLKLFSVASGVLFSLFCYGATVVDDDMDWLVPIIKAAVDKAKENAGGGGAGGGTSRCLST